MQLRKATYNVIAAAIMALALPAQTTAACERLWVVDHELWSAEGDQTRLLVADVHGVLYPRWSPAGASRAGITRPPRRRCSSSPAL